MEKKVNSSVLYSIQVHRIQVHLAFQCFPSLSLLTAGSFPPGHISSLGLSMKTSVSMPLPKRPSSFLLSIPFLQPNDGSEMVQIFSDNDTKLGFIPHLPTTSHHSICKIWKMTSVENPAIDAATLTIMRSFDYPLRAPADRHLGISMHHRPAQLWMTAGTTNTNSCFKTCRSTADRLHPIKS